MVLIGRISTVFLMFFATLFALMLENALQAFQIVLQIGAGTGLIFILRWFWWRINAYSELAAMIGAATFSILFIFIENFVLVETGGRNVEIWGIETTMTYWNIVKFTGVVFLTSLSWLLVTAFTHPISEETLRSFYKKIRPGGPGWKPVVDRAKAEGVELVKEKDLKWDVPTGIICMLLGSITIYSILFTIGNILYGKFTHALVLILITIAAAYLLLRSWKRLTTASDVLE